MKDLAGEGAEELGLAVRVCALDLGDALGVVPAVQEALDGPGDAVWSELAKPRGELGLIAFEQFGEMSAEQPLQLTPRGIVAEADDLGISFFVIAGGEPLTRPEIIDIAQEFPQVVFLLVTNGLLLSPPLIERLARLRKVVPVLSIEGNQAETDQRRGSAVFGEDWIPELIARGSQVKCAAGHRKQGRQSGIAAE